MSVSLKELQKALLSLEEALHLMNQAQDVAHRRALRDACIQRFQFCVELSWNCAKIVLGTQANSPKTVVRELGREGLIDDLRGFRVWIFGSRARGDYQRYSDVDVLIDGDVDPELGSFEEIFENSNFPYKVDFVLSRRLASSYRKNVDQEKQEVL